MPLARVRHARPPHHRFRTVIRALGAAVATLAVTAAMIPGAAHAATGGYVALGDSYSSGTGTEIYYSDGTGCQRSPKSYSVLIAQSRGLDLTLAACSGATSSDVVNQQLSSLRADTSLVTITVGGNDVGFVPVLTECAKPGWWGDCDGAVNDALRVVDNELAGRLANLYGRIADRSPNARLVVSGYPHLFNGEDCHLLTFFSSSEMTKLNNATDRLNVVIRDHATSGGHHYVDPVPSFSGHAVCDDAEWVNGLSWPVSESYHPNVAGHQGYAAVFGAEVGARTGVAARADARTASPARAASPSLPHAVARSERITAPDLTSAGAKAAARRAGINKHDLDAMSAAQRNGASNATLEKMSRRAEQRANR